MPVGHKVTVTGKTGVGATVTALQITNVTDFRLNVLTNFLTVVGDQGRFEFDISAATTFTVTIATGVYTVTIS